MTGFERFKLTVLITKNNANMLNYIEQNRINMRNPLTKRKKGSLGIRQYKHSVVKVTKSVENAGNIYKKQCCTSQI